MCGCPFCSRSEATSAVLGLSIARLLYLWRQCRCNCSSTCIHAPFLQITRPSCSSYCLHAHVLCHTCTQRLPASTSIKSWWKSQRAATKTRAWYVLCDCVCVCTCVFNFIMCILIHIFNNRRGCFDRHPSISRTCMCTCAHDMDRDAVDSSCECECE